MSKIKFIYMKNIYEIKYNKNDLTINNLLFKYSSLINIPNDQLYFLYKSKNINNIKNISELNDITIFVYNIKMKKNKNNEELTDIICPKCKNLAIINNNNDKLSINCLNNHKFIDLTINSFYENQYIDESLINCNKCGNNKCCYNKFYIDSNNKYICPLCSKGNNNIIDYEYRFNICINHNKKYISYCNNCNINICEKCEEKHKKHKIINYKEIKPNEKRIKEIKEDEIKINKYKEELKLLNKYLNNFINDLVNEIDIYIKIYKNIKKNSDYLNNYESIKNILDFKSKELISEINYYFLNEKNKLKNIMNRYENNKNEINIIYNIKYDEKEIRIFGKEFVENNKNNCYLLINNKKYEISEYYKLNKEREELKMKLKEKNIINDMSYMFSGCESLSSLPDISKWNTNNVNNMSYMFNNCSSLSSLPDISKWNTNNVNKMSWMFSHCSSLSSLPDISKWNTNNVNDINYMFYNCILILYIPNLE